MNRKNVLDIKVPIWKSKAFGVADFRLQGDGDIFVTCSYVDKSGNYIYPHTYRMSKEKARRYSKIKMGSYIGREIPVSAFEVINDVADVIFDGNE